jgi:hypothetical protein
MLLDEGAIIATALTFDFAPLQHGAFATLNERGVGVLAQLKQRHVAAFAQARVKNHFLTQTTSPPTSPSTSPSTSPLPGGSPELVKLVDFNRGVKDDIDEWKKRVVEERAKLQRIHTYTYTRSDQTDVLALAAIEPPSILDGEGRCGGGDGDDDVI